MSEFRNDLIEFLKVLADQTRLEILDLINNESKTSAQIQSALEKSQSTISQHLKVLTNSNIIKFERKDNVKYYEIKNVEIFKILIDIKSFIDSMSNNDVIDTLL
ncbi:MAG: ArsR family transcriptional regulator [Candidatus Lokiarchaeota archaeon]|nr:ArsR family transcriptional regulator [Candidatus Lokiarchaeota archaeon]